MHSFIAFIHSFPAKLFIMKSSSPLQLLLLALALAVSVLLSADRDNGVGCLLWVDAKANAKANGNANANARLVVQPQSKRRQYEHRRGGWRKWRGDEITTPSTSTSTSTSTSSTTIGNAKTSTSATATATATPSLLRNAVANAVANAVIAKQRRRTTTKTVPRGGSKPKTAVAVAAIGNVHIEDPGSKPFEEIIREWGLKHQQQQQLLSSSSSSSSVSSPFLSPDTATATATTTATATATTTLLTQGLTEDEATALRKIYGTNAMEELPPPSWLALIAEQFEDKLVRILVGVAILSALLEFTPSGGGSGSGSGSGTAAAGVAASAAAAFSSAAGSATGTESLWHRFAEPLVISCLLVINASVGVWQSKSAGSAIEALKAMQPSVCTILRRKSSDIIGSSCSSSSSSDNDNDDGTSKTKTKSKTRTSTTQEIADFPAEDLVPGDLIVLKTGDKVPADCRLVKYYNGRRSLTVDETCLTGESLSVEKLLGDEGLAPPNSPVQAQRGMVFAGTTVVGGGGLALVVATGTNTEFGTIRSGVLDAKKDTHDQKTPLGKQLDAFGNQLTTLIGGICALVWIASIPKMFAKDSTVFASPLEGMVYYAKVAVALGVAAIPEGLPAVITLCLSLGTRRMAQRNVIVRNLPSVETLGCVSVICSDKTGTLTTNEMTVTSLVLLEKQENKQQNNHIVEHTVEGVSYSPLGGIEGISDSTNTTEGGKRNNNNNNKIDRSSSLIDVVAVASLCNDARIIGHDQDDDDTPSKNFERTGEPTEAALCVLAEKLGNLISISKERKNGAKNSVLASYHVDQWREEHPRMATLEFHRERKSE